MTFRKILFVWILTLLIGTPIAFAGGATPIAPIKNYNGFFGGIGVGVTATSFSDEGTASVMYFNPALAIISSSTNFTAGSSNEDFIGELHLGYGRQLGSSNLYLGAVVGTNFTTHTPNGVVSNSVLVVPFSFEDRLTHKSDAHLRTVEVTFDLHPGVLLSPKSLLYAVIGVAFNRLTYRVSTDFTNDFIPVTYTTSAQVSRNIAGLRAGLGLEQKLNRSIALFLQYVYTRYGSLATGKEASFLSPTGSGTVDTVSASGSARPTRHSVLFGVDWYFSQ